MQQEKAWVDHLLESIIEGIVTLDAQGNITYFSPGAARITGWDPHATLGLSCNRVFQPVEDNQAFTDLLPPPGGRRKIPVRLRTGQQVVLAVTGARLVPPGDNDTQIALVFRDISEEEMLHRLVGHFMANIAHEFFTPLSALGAAVELLKDQVTYLTPAELQELLTSLHLSVLGLQTFVDNLLESASIEAGKFHVHVHPVNLSDIVNDAIHIMKPLLEKRGQWLALDVPDTLPKVCADARRTVQVLVNLLANASKYGPDNAPITIRVIEKDNALQIEVLDQGPGIPLLEQEALFRSFSRSEVHQDKTQAGVGLGLSVVKATVEAQGGCVGVQNISDGGAKFWFTLPTVNEV